MKTPTLGQLATDTGAQVVGDPTLAVRGLAPLDQAGEGQLSFLSNPLYLPQALTSSAAAVIVSPADLDRIREQGRADGRNWLVARNPYVCFARIAQQFDRAANQDPRTGIDPRASVADDAVVPASCHIGPNVVIEAGARLGERVRVLANTYIGAGAQIGDDTLLYANVSIYHGCVVGQRCIVHSGAVIGADGFGFAPDIRPDGVEYVKIPQTGRAVLGNDVEIGANTAIDRGAMGDTVVEDGCKIDNQVQIAHNVRVGAHTVIAGCAAIAGSTKVGRFCVIGGSANFAGHLQIADRTTVSGGTSITKSIAKPGQHFTSVFPFLPHGDWERNAAIVRGLSKLRERVVQLEKRLRGQGPDATTKNTEEKSS
ncbi:UDP-3-O-[3-hydroxymyristoyl] glucosamine N-acyltransferase [Cupriavidus gilardii CR3]|uniref:UDP-3-O-acylglucosamine N-acyltransferase n=1 Tax=Cupriavidus gilardii TaxID=82541 RepID=A0A849B8X9_9BURK|nr:UDP-3-O-(3-hydroxymyristoyl)glucosamine N-acyltransferase [Cupriavidus gilardii]ALD90407.1 UDP-3-O-[3-hydroxymyristoyl] glucosamine N-acyltransferase [Cupriavidus gilardii CR3]KAB0595857.1 UDP-3-O-(3-hydroxymyristoyl)glucosamine N-acyltransferase [Cupriavidus gilardii]MCT9016304.1 UDP-3-O-(3-hydroxymyristoyl)glucosamine N-acyltransferase [Cupriavidus gilardii]MCT9056074.1 UDP-3-O-(3-hydroxymyristoyl)glucosamine N-acyltransferase [Cupriavidus gilardii]NNH10363.1 UDP-3-O-(3-hydroxymyristoyl)g